MELLEAYVQPNLSRFSLPESMQTKEVQTLVNNYNDAHEKMRNVVTQCNSSLEYGEGQRKSLAELDAFFKHEANHNQNRDVYELFAKARHELFTPHEQEFEKYCNHPDTYRVYIKNYYGQNQWFAFQPSSTSDKQTSMINIAARFLNTQIIVHQKTN